jgi:hypothetical protein
LAPAAAEAPAEAPEPALYRPRDTAENAEVRLRTPSFTADVGLSPAAPGPGWPVPVVAELDVAELDVPELVLAALVVADPAAGSVSEAGYGGTAAVASAGDPAS